MRLRYCFLLLIFLSSFASLAQRKALVRLKAGIERAEGLLQKLRATQDSLQALPDVPQDSVNLEANLDSLRSQELDSTALTGKADSFTQSFLDQQQVQEQLKKAEGRLEQEINQAKEALTRRLSPEEAQQALSRLEDASQFGTASLPDAGSMSQISQMPDLQLSQLGRLQELPDPEGLQENLRETAEKAAMDQLARQQERLSQKVPDLEAYKSRVEKLGSVRDLPKDALKVQPMGNRPWQDRVVLGSLWQLGKQEVYFLDLAPSLAWRFTERLSAGAGFQYRLSLDVQRKPWSLGTHDKVLGYFAFSDFEVKEGFFGRLHYEDLSSPVPRLDAATQAEAVGQEWVKGLSVGVGKSYSLFQQVQGYALLQYNVLHRHGRTPYLHPLQAKVGLYINGSHLLKRKDR